MPVCNGCGESFDVEKERGALFFTHPKTVKTAAIVKKYHICQRCERRIVSRFKIK
jgi:hypothetical protein